MLAGTGEELVEDSGNGGEEDNDDEHHDEDRGRSDDAFPSVSAMHLASPAVFAAILSSLLPCLGHTTASSVRIAASEAAGSIAVKYDASQRATDDNGRALLLLPRMLQTLIERWDETNASWQLNEGIMLVYDFCVSRLLPALKARHKIKKEEKKKKEEEEENERASLATTVTEAHAAAVVAELARIDEQAAACLQGSVPFELRRMALQLVPRVRELRVWLYACMGEVIGEKAEEKDNAATAAALCLSSLASAVANGTEGQGGGADDDKGVESAQEALTSALDLCVLCARLGTSDARAQVLRALAARARESCRTMLLAWEQAKEETRRNAVALGAVVEDEEEDGLPPRLLTESPRRGGAGSLTRGDEQQRSVGGMLSLAAATGAAAAAAAAGGGVGVGIGDGGSGSGGGGIVNSPPRLKTLRQASVTTQMLASGLRSNELRRRRAMSIDMDAVSLANSLELAGISLRGLSAMGNGASSSGATGKDSAANSAAASPAASPALTPRIEQLERLDGERSILSRFSTGGASVDLALSEARSSRAGTFTVEEGEEEGGGDGGDDDDDNDEWDDWDEDSDDEDVDETPMARALGACAAEVLSLLGARATKDWAPLVGGEREERALVFVLEVYRGGGD